jgi:hypothetical protein
MSGTECAYIIHRCSLFREAILRGDANRLDFLYFSCYKIVREDWPELKIEAVHFTRSDGGERLRKIITQFKM